MGHGMHPIAPESVTLGQLYLLIVEQKHDIAVQGQRIVDLTGEVAQARRETAEMVELYKSGKTIVSLFKIAGGIAAAALALWGLVALIRGVPHPGAG